MTRLLFRVAIVGLLLLGNDRLAIKTMGDEFSPGTFGTYRIPVLTNGDQLDGYNGRLVAVRGVILNSKSPRILGVEVRADDKLRGQEAYAVGLLIRWNETTVDPHVQNSGPGTKYFLYFDLSGRLAEARPIPRK